MACAIAILSAAENSAPVPGGFVIKLRKQPDPAYTHLGSRALTKLLLPVPN